MRDGHRWLVTGPWYRWPQPGVKASGRGSTPVIEKFASSDFIEDFQTEPQRSLRFDARDLVHEVVAGGSRFSLSGKTRRPVRPECRKLFLDTHCRFYLVVCELHCDAAGLPSVDRGDVCEAGFVVRRRRAEVPAAVFDELVSALEERAAARGRILDLHRLASPRRGRGAVFEKVLESLRGDCAPRTTELLRRYSEVQERLDGLVGEHGVALAHQGWKPGEHPGVGGWEDVEETPQSLDEEIHPLYPLIPDPDDRSHSASKRTMYFGVVPTASALGDELGNRRFDDRSLYEIRCFVRRHKPECPRTSRPGDCPGEIVWSRSTEKYRLAAPMDVDGTGNCPVTIQLPDLEDLEAQAEEFPRGANVRMVTPPGSSLPFSVDGTDLGSLSGGSGGAEICFFSIPLITIVANFVLRLFMPIVVFVFGLWFLLRLRFCIPPSLSFAAAANLDLAVAGELGEAIGDDLDIDVGLETRLGITMDRLDDDIEAIVRDTFGNTVGQSLLSDPALGVGVERRNRLVKLVLDLASDFSADAPADLAGAFDPFEPGPAASLPSMAAGLRYHDVLEVPTA